MITTIIIFILTILVLVVSHELGHFIVAKKFGIKVLEFGFGLPPRVFGKQWGETLISLNWLPIGGFVKLLGEDGIEEEVLKNKRSLSLRDKRSFSVKPVSQRIGVVVAGVVMNLILAVILFWIVLGFQGFKQEIPLIVPFHFIGVNQTNVTSVVIGDVAPDSPASQAGIQVGDRVTQINGTSIQTSEQMIALSKQNEGKEINLIILSPDNESRVAKITPRINPPAGQGAMGVGLSNFSMAKLSYDTLGQKIMSGFSNSYNMGAYSMVILKELIAQSIATGNAAPVAQSVAGPVGITTITNTILQTKSPFIPYLNFVALLSLNLAIVNILPFPALDGGRLVFLLFEGLTRKKVKPEVERWVNNIGMAILIGLIFLVTFSDIKKLLP